MNNQQILVKRAQLAEQAERYEDMFLFVKQLVQSDIRLNDEQYKLFANSAKHVVGARRSAWRVISSAEHKSQDEDEKSMIVEYREEIEKELRQHCDEVLRLLENNLLKTEEGSGIETEVFCRKMQGDYYRYLVEVASGDEKSPVEQKANEAYAAATDAASVLSSTHPVKLGLAMNYSIFYYEILNEPKTACQLAKNAFDAALMELDNMDEDAYEESTLIMQLIRDNLTLWTADSSAGDDENG